MAALFLFATNTKAQMRAAEFVIDTASRPIIKFKFFPHPSLKYRWGLYHTTDITKTHKPFKESKIVYDTDSTFSIDTRDSLGVYRVCLEVTDYRGDKDTVCKRMMLKFETVTIPPNVFVPGKDSTGKLREFSIGKYNFAKYELVIFDRWGQKVFESKDQKKGWNGKAMNPAMDCPAGTYYYILKYTLPEKPDEELTLNGTVTLIRE
ncbi:MAG: gliding motility-associated C-terminal domain-containing protein [Bacteroidota bacterium]